MTHAASPAVLSNLEQSIQVPQHPKAQHALHTKNSVQCAAQYTQSNGKCNMIAFDLWNGMEEMESLGGRGQSRVPPTPLR